MTLATPVAVPETPARRDPAWIAAGPVLVGVLLFVSSLAALRFTSFESLPLIWPTNALATVAVLCGPRDRRWEWGVLAAATGAIGLAAVLTMTDLLAALSGTIACMVEIMLAVWLVRRFAMQGERMTSGETLARFLACVALAAPAVAAVAASPFVLRVKPDETFLSVWWQFFAPDALGMMLIAPFALALTGAETQRLKARAREAAIVALVGLAATVALFTVAPLAAMLLIPPMLIFATVRFGVVGAGTATSLLFLIGASLTLSGLGPIAALPGAMPEKVLWMQAALAAMALSTLPLAAVLAERDRYEAEMLRARLRAEAANDAKSRLLANVSHEIKSPISGVIGIGEMWAAGRFGPMTPLQDEMSGMLVRTARQIERLALDLLDVARAEAGTVALDLRPTDLEAVAEDVRRDLALRPEAAKLKLEIQREGESRIVAKADSVRLTQVVTNLANNAVKYGASGGVVIFRLYPVGSEKVRIEVVDHGPGIPESKHKELFEPFNRLDADQTTVEGHGIGLAIARRLTELQGGTLGVDSSPGHGARFWVELQRA